MLAKLLSDLRSALSAAKSIERVMALKTFADVYDKAGAVERARLEHILTALDVVKFHQWFKDEIAKHKTLGEKTVVELRIIAQRLKVPSYFSMPKSELLSEIEKRSKVG